jgi:hypothetical protein
MDPFMRMVKIFVVVAGVLLVAGSITLVALLITRGTGGGSRSASFDQTLPVKGEILSIETQGDTLAILVEQDAVRIVVLVDAETGKLRGTLRTEPE